MNDSLKYQAAMAALDEVKPGMILGLGTGSTVTHYIRELGNRVRDGLKVKAIATSLRSEELAREGGVPIVSFADSKSIDLTVDGADEVSADLQLTKGLGGALVREKIVARASRRFVIVVDDSKLVDRLGTRSPIPVEVVPFAADIVAWDLQTIGGEPRLRMADGRSLRVGQRKSHGRLVHRTAGRPGGAGTGSEVDRRGRGLGPVREHGRPCPCGRRVRCSIPGAKRMSPLFLNEDEVAGLVSVRETIDVLETAFANQATGGATTLPRRRLATDRLFLHILAGAVPGYFGYKTYATGKGKPRFHFYLYDSETAAMLAIMQADSLGQIRTGAATGLATRLLARRTVKVATLFGAWDGRPGASCWPWMRFGKWNGCGSSTGPPRRPRRSFERWDPRFEPAWNRRHRPRMPFRRASW